MLTIHQNVAAHSLKSTELHSDGKVTSPSSWKTNIFIMEFLRSDMITIPEFLEGIGFESWQELTDVYRCIDGFFGHSRQVRLSDVTSASFYETTQM